jgi:hypothetical protein
VPKLWPTIVTSAGSFEFGARDILAATPRAPRRVPLLSVIRGLGFDEFVRNVLVLGGLLVLPEVLFLAGGGVAQSWPPDPVATGIGRGIFLLSFVIGVFVLIAAPVWRARIVQRALVRGTLCRARVVGTGLLAPYVQPSLWAIRAGAAWYTGGDEEEYVLKKGWRRVRLLVADPKGEFTSEFQIDAPWATDLRVGRRLDLLVDAARKPLLVVGYTRDRVGIAL